MRSNGRKMCHCMAYSGSNLWNLFVISTTIHFFYLLTLSYVSTSWLSIYLQNEVKPYMVGTRVHLADLRSSTAMLMWSFEGRKRATMSFLRSCHWPRIASALNCSPLLDARWTRTLTAWCHPFCGLRRPWRYVGSAVRVSRDLCTRMLPMTSMLVVALCRKLLQ